MPTPPACHDPNQPVAELMRAATDRLDPRMTVAQSLERFRETGLGERITYFYVVDTKERLVGVLPARRLLAAPLEATIGDLAEPRVRSLPAEATVREACRALVESRLLALPVLGADGVLRGVVDVTMVGADLSAAAEAEEVFQLLGMHLATARHRSAVASFRDRFPWLLSNLAGGTACALLLGRFEGLLLQAVVLSLFIPVVLAVSESVGMQAVTLTLQRLHPAAGRLADGLRRELAAALLLGTGCGLLVAGVAWAWRGQPPAALAIGLSIVAAVTWAGFLGATLPVAVYRLRRDPSVAAGPIVLALTDMAAVALYLALGARLLG